MVCICCHKTSVAPSYRQSSQEDCWITLCGRKGWPSKNDSVRYLYILNVSCICIESANYRIMIKRFVFQTKIVAFHFYPFYWKIIFKWSVKMLIIELSWKMSSHQIEALVLSIPIMCRKKAQIVSAREVSFCNLPHSHGLELPFPASYQSFTVFNIPSLFFCIS